MTISEVKHNSIDRSHLIDQYIQSLEARDNLNERAKWLLYGKAKRWFCQNCPGITASDYDSFIKRVTKALNI